MALESLLRVFWHFWRCIEYFSELSESIGMHFEAFWKRSDAFLKHLKNLSSTSKYVEISTWALFNAMEELQINDTFRVFLKVLRKCSEVFFQLKRNQKHIYNVIIRPKLSVVGKRESLKFYPLPNLQIYSPHNRHGNFPFVDEMTHSFFLCDTQISNIPVFESIFSMYVG